MRQPTEREVEVHDLVLRTESPEAAAAVLGISRGAVLGSLARYHRNVCADREAELLERIRFLEARLRRAESGSRVTHRRKADGGIGGRAERRAGRAA